MFQKAKGSNAFANRLKSVFEIGVLPEDAKALPLEMTPVDLCAKAMLKLSQTEGTRNAVYHLYNHNTITMQDLVIFARESLPEPAFVSPEVFRETLRDMSRKSDGKKLTGIVNDLSWQDAARKNVVVRSGRTVKALHRAGFDWPKLSKEYIVRFLLKICEP